MIYEFNTLIRDMYANSMATSGFFKDIKTEEIVDDNEFREILTSSIANIIKDNCANANIYDLIAAMDYIETIAHLIGYDRDEVYNLRRDISKRDGRFIRRLKLKSADLLIANATPEIKAEPIKRKKGW